MEKLILNSGLSGFVILDEISHAGPGSIKGRKRFESAPLYLGIESLAQLGAYHVRFLCGFRKHAFLLGVKRCELPREPELTGTWMLFGRLVSRSGSAFAYELIGTGPGDAGMQGEFLFATSDYNNDALREDILKSHYEKVFSCLRSGFRKN